jgi:alpha-D-xyloside xylohydrolase
MFFSEGNRLTFRYDDHTLWLEPWGPNALRVRATKLKAMPSEDWALSEALEDVRSSVSINISKDGAAAIANGNITAKVSRRGKVTMYDSSGRKLLEEYARHRLDLEDPKCSALNIEAREFRGIAGGDFHTTLRLESVDPDEKLYGLGQYQQPYLNLKGTDIELAQRNSQASVPFMVSSLGYGLLWNNPAVGRAVLGRNTMSFESYSTKVIDFWVVAESTPAKIVEAYAKVSGYVPMMPEYGFVHDVF